jgi:hypothetical protein
MNSRKLFASWFAPQATAAILLLRLSGMFAVGQGVPTTASQPVPVDASGRFALIQKLNGLDTSGSHAWHIKLAYDHFDSDGDNDSSGSYEEWFVSPKRYKRIYSSGDFNRIEVATEGGLFVTGSQKWPGAIALQVPREVIDPTYWAVNDAHPTRMGTINWPVGDSTLPCVIFRPTEMRVSDNALHKYCVTPDDTALRYSRGQGWDEIVYNSVSSFQGRFVPQSLKVTQAKDPYLEVRVVAIEDLPHPDDLLFTPTKEAVLQSKPIEVASSVLIMTKNPGSEWIRGEKGKAVVELVIGKDGRVKKAKGIEGPPNLKELAAE